jgi:hypothetical protein
MIPPGIKNLYMVSDTVGDAFGIGMQAAADVSMKAVESILAHG